MNLDLAGWSAGQAALRARAEAAIDDPRALPALLGGWPIALGPETAGALVGALDPPDTQDLAALCAWIEPDLSDDGVARPVAAWDERALARRRSGDGRARRIAALALLARVGEAYRLREHELPARQRWQAGANDAAVGAAWTALLGPRPSVEAGRALQGRFRGSVRASVVGVATVLRLPVEVGASHAERAIEQLDLVFPLAAGELAAWVVETAGEPVGALAAALGASPRDKVARCVASRARWVEVRDQLGLGDVGRDLPEGTAALVLGRLAASLAQGRAPPHELGLPGWGVVVANRARVRGRLRMAAALDPVALGRRLLALDALEARTAAALGRFSWAWAWREARKGFGFDLDGVSAPTCEPGPPAPAALLPLTEADRPALRTLALLIAGRGCWEDWERWIEGEGRGLGRGLYRCLDAAPDALLDPAAPDRRDRGYERLRGWLLDGGLDALMPELARAAEAVATTRPGRDLRAQLREALSPWWDERAIAFPQHHLPGFREGLLHDRFRDPSSRTAAATRR